jgi:hypothetical protein
MFTPPSHQDVLKLVTTGYLFIEQRRDGIWFDIRNEQVKMTGRIIIRPDWIEGPDDRPGLMPMIASLEHSGTGYREEGYEPAVEKLSAIYKALRERLSPSKLFRRQKGRWILRHTDFGLRHAEVPQPIRK